ncbi:SAP domain-containing ribonucleoprotein [Geosmithia morbida]|uniref:SAP domain-containing ribonucleoprotein n=1 Tax=Geosmithia morbida TaxID=1094350 RepID=A0A9P4YUB4_9HYPO|nr:SAP domain-containing ribonucleoprotein [Geosmithia morbida]KAF4121828.1 SAP domain-containing ribonucleoprotein [Geosmithia morbida]
MATEYSSLKVPELKKLLSEKGLPQSGNKADLVARLNEHDKSAGADAAAQDDEPASKKAGESPFFFLSPPEHPQLTLGSSTRAHASKEDEITYSDDEAPKAAAPAAVEAEPAGQEAGEKTEEGAPAAAAAAAAAAAEEPAEDAAADATEEAAAPAAPAASYAIGLSSTAAEEEARKRAERAKRFGIDEDDDAKKRAERAARFGIDAKELASSLDSALPERPLKRGRGAESGSGNRPGKRQSLDRRGGRDGGGRRRGNDNSRNAAPAKSSGILDDPAERAKAEKRAARFAAA